MSSRQTRSLTQCAWAVFAALILAPKLTAAGPPDPFANDVTAIRARQIITVNSGIIHNGIVLIRNGKIVSVGTGVKIPVGAAILTCDTVMPGIVGLSSQIG